MEGRSSQAIPLPPASQPMPSEISYFQQGKADGVRNSTQSERRRRATWKLSALV